ncbi:MAG: hypothetical protein D8M58_12440 [Calditrichaeota bacterium]|nr:MAG: hypothetical protein DWQ03_13225 [Calditrichota bacterium]MBL1206205.1 hypothetical protein [Calditrichota bacterium]NOG46030.1 hypothetical protein [Calditrichota bacterium]
MQKTVSRILFGLLICVLISCNDVTDIFPEDVNSIKHIENYHCWPYNVSVYSIDQLEIDSLFFTYPLKSYFEDYSIYEVSTWSLYSEYDTVLWHGFDKTLRACDGNIELINQVMKKVDIYYSGCYRYVKDRDSEDRKRYEKILFLDLRNKKLHIFQDINKIY